MTDTIKQQNITIQNRLNNIKDIEDTSNQKYYYLSISRRYRKYISILFIWLYWIIYFIMLIALLNSTKFSLYIKIGLSIFMLLFPFYRAIYNFLIVLYNFIVDMFIH